MAGYDVIALGPGLATTLAAALIARRGRRVLLAPGREIPRPVKRGAMLLEPGPQVLSGLTRPVVRDLLAELELTRFLDERTRNHHPAYQVILPRARIDVGPDDEELLDQLERELGLAVRAGERLLVQLALASRATERLLDPRGRRIRAMEPEPELPALHRHAELDSTLSAIFNGPAAAEAPLLQPLVGAIPTARLWSSWRTGCSSLLGGLGSLELELHEQILRAGGEILPGADAQAFLCHGGAVRGVALEGRPGITVARQFLVGLDPARLCDEQMLGPLLRPLLPDRPTVAARRYAMHLVFRRGWLPESMGSHLLVFPPSSETEVPLRATVVEGPPDNDEVVLTVQGTLPAADCHDAGIQQARERMLAAVHQVVPFADEGLLACVPDENPGEPVYVVPGAIDPLAAAPALPLDVGHGTAALVHPLVLGALGTEGAFVTARAAVELLCA